MDQSDIEMLLQSETALKGTSESATIVDDPESKKTSGKGKGLYQVVYNEAETLQAAPSRQIDFPKTAEIQRILRLQVPIIVRLAEKVMPMGEVVKLAPGAIIEFNKTVSEPLELMINNKCIGTGQTVKVGEKFGLRITNLSTISQVIKAMAGK
ncbi:MAG: FliM/FliN family flagellar motor switch protein [Phycisphaerae bacterium]|jgi:flagellar motor switch protein FliN/FliY|nr:FliM/FliN family flagellar motor switch protein [Phycisphaerae bacterium]